MASTEWIPAAAPGAGAAALLILLSTAAVSAALAQAGPGGDPYLRWSRGPWADPNYFPIAVWLQSPSMAPRYKAAGVNLYVALWGGPTEQQLSDLSAAGMPVICDQNEVGLRHVDDPVIIGWMHGDEPDNAQALERGEGYGPPIAPERIVADYEHIRAADPSRPVMLNLGQGVAYDGWIGRGVRTNHPEDYPLYIKGCDIASFDIYPVAHDRPEVRGNLWFVARGVERLRQWAAPQQAVWNCIECTRISSEAKATPAQVRAEVWMSLIHGSMGLIYFVHEWNPRFNEHALLDDAEMLRGVTAINRQIAELAPVLRSPTIADGVRVTSSDAAVPVAAMVKRQGGATYLFAVSMRDSPTTATFELGDLPEQAEAEALGEGRRLPVAGGKLQDSFTGYEVRLYRIR
jgi:hypothetical protein